MGKHNHNFNENFNDDYQDNHSVKKTFQNKKKEQDIDYDDLLAKEYDKQKQRTKNRRESKLKDKNKYDNYDEWN